MQATSPFLKASSDLFQRIYRLTQIIRLCDAFYIDGILLNLSISQLAFSASLDFNCFPETQTESSPPQFLNGFVGASLGLRLLPRGWRLGAPPTAQLAPQRPARPPHLPGARLPHPPPGARALRDRRDGWCLCQRSGGTSHAR